MIVNGLTDPTPCCPSEDAQFFELDDTFVTLCYGIDSRCAGCTVPEMDWTGHESATEAACSKVEEGVVYRSDPLPIVVPELEPWIGLAVALAVTWCWMKLLSSLRS